MKRLIYLLPILLAACSAKQNPVKPTVLVTDLTQGTITYYGEYYKGLPQNVVSLDLYSAGISFDDKGYVQGSGTNLYISDVFIPQSDTILTEGIYQCDTTGTERTFLPGMDFENNPTGTYILRIEDAQIAGLMLCSDSSFVFTQAGDTTDIQFNLIADKQKYKLHFRGVLKYEDGRQHL